MSVGAQAGNSGRLMMRLCAPLANFSRHDRWRRCWVRAQHLVGARRSVLSEDLPPGVVKAEIHDTTDRIEIQLTSAEEQQQIWLVDPVSDDPRALASLDLLREKAPQVYALFQSRGRSTARWVGDLGQSLGGLFLRLLKMVAVPLIITSLASGVMSLGKAADLSRLFTRTLAYYLCTSMLAIIIGLCMVNLIRPGLRGGQQPRPRQEAEVVSGDLTTVLYDQVLNMIPTNPLGAMAEGNFLSIISFTLIFSVFALVVGGESLRTLKGFFEAAFETMMALTMAVIRLAPLGVLFLMLYVTATQGPEVFRALFLYMVTVLTALSIHAFVVLPLIVWVFAKRNPWRYAQAMAPALMTAFSSASSNGALPLTIASVEKRAGISNKVSSFVLPLGATINMDGTALYEAVAVLFIAQLHYGRNLELSQQIIVALTALLASIGAAGIPHAGLVMMVIILQAVGLPVELQGVILAVDRVLDMCRTSVNVWSDACGCAVVARLENLDGQAA